MKIRSLLFKGGALAAALAFTAPAHAQIPTIDLKALTQLKEQLSTATKQLSALQQQTTQLTQMRNTIGQIGPGQLGSMLEGAGINFAGGNGVKGMLGDIVSMGDQMNDMLSKAGNATISGEGSLNIGRVTDLASGRDAASKLFFYGGEELTQERIGQLRDRRNAVLRDTAISGFGAAAAMKGDMTESQKLGDKLSAQAKSAADLRGDVQANTATLLAIYAEITKQTALQAQLLQIESAKTLSTDSTGRRR